VAQPVINTPAAASVTTEATVFAANPWFEKLFKLSNTFQFMLSM
jgi:hypothetical protein